MEIPDVAMGKILQSDILDVCIGGVAYINITFSDEVGEMFFVHFFPVLCFDFQRGWHWGGGNGVAVVCVVVVGGGCGCGGGVSRYLDKNDNFASHVTFAG
jgi:hypothetical protein